MSERILEVVNEIKDDIKYIKENMVSKEICAMKCTTSNKKIAILTSFITGIFGSLILMIKYYVGRK